MKAFTRRMYCSPDKLQLEEIERPQVKDGYVLVKVQANSANPADWHMIRGVPFAARFVLGLFKPKQKIPGSDFVGEIVETGANVKEFKVGDRVFGESLAGGAFAEYISVPEKVCAKMPGTKGFAEMAALPIAGLTALQGLITHGKLAAGEHVLINGSSGGVGHLCVQIAKAHGAKVTAICSRRNADFVKSLGASQVIAHDEYNIHKLDGKYDLVVDTHGNLFHSDFKRLGNRGVVIGFTTMKHMIALSLRSAVSGYKVAQFTAAANSGDLRTLAMLADAGTVKPHIEKQYSFRDIPTAVSHIESMRTRGKVVMVWGDIIS